MKIVTQRRETRANANVLHRAEFERKTEENEFITKWNFEMKNKRIRVMMMISEFHDLHLMSKQRRAKNLQPSLVRQQNSILSQFILS